MLDAIAKPFGWLMLQLYNLTNNYGVAVILFALVVKLIMLPFQLKSKTSASLAASVSTIMRILFSDGTVNPNRFRRSALFILFPFLLSTPG